MRKDSFYIPYIGKKFGRITINSLAGKIQRSDGRNYVTVNCTCECGNLLTAKFSDVINGHTQSCGCLRADNHRKALTTHGMSYHPLFQVYEGMMDRCHDPKDQGFHNYGGRGIEVCTDWREDKNAFFTWAKENGWAKGLELDRRENDLGYSPSNCRFITKKANQNNKRTNHTIIYDGVTKTIAEWCESLSLNYTLTLKRILRGWSTELAFTKPDGYKLSNPERIGLGLKPATPPVKKKKVVTIY